MKRLIFALLLCLQFSLQAQDSLNTGNLVVVLTGFENNEGVVRVALANSEKDYRSNSSVFRGMTGAITDNRSEVVFADIPTGEYAVKVFHDRDNNEKLNTNILGIPTEDYGFSNNAPARLGPPAWEDARFTFEAGQDTIYISVD